MEKFLFISNSTKPSSEELNDRSLIRASNVHKPSLDLAKEMGYEVYLGVNRNKPEELNHEQNVKLYDSHTYRSLVDIKSNFIAFKNCADLLRKGQFKVIHCNTPIGGIVGRICGRFFDIEHIIYTAHGFHFFKGSSFFARTIIKSVERLMARWTDVIITMNKEDFDAAKKFKLRKDGNVYLVHGVGIDTSEYSNITVDRKLKREELKLKENDNIIISVGDLIDRKNHSTAIRAISSIKDDSYHLLICGEGPAKKALASLVEKLNIQNQVHFLGHRTDVKELLSISDLYLFASYQEGLPRSVMEAMAVGLPCVVSNIRGNIDLIENGKNGFLVEVEDFQMFAKKIIKVVENDELKEIMKKNTLSKIKDYDLSNVKKELKVIYEKEFPILNK